MKKKICSLLLGVTLISCLSSCTNNELSYLELNRSFINNTGVYDLNYDINIDTGNLLPIESEENISISFDSSIDMENSKMISELLVSLADKNFDLGTVFIADNDIKITGQTLLGYLDLLRTVYPTEYDFLYSEDVWLNLSNTLSYIEVMTLGLTSDGMNIIYDTSQYNVISTPILESCLSLFEEGFVDFTSGFVNKVGGNYLMNINGYSIENFIINLLAYCKTNADLVVDKYTDYALKVAAIAGATDNELEAIEDNLTEQFPVDLKSRDALFNSYKNSFDDFINDPQNRDIFDNSVFTSKIVPTDDGFTSVSNLIVADSKDVLMAMYCNASLSKSDLTELIIPEHERTISETLVSLQTLAPISDVVNDTLDFINPYASLSTIVVDQPTGVIIKWANGTTEPYAALVNIRDGVEQEATAIQIDFRSIDGQSLVPLRTVCNSLGLMVGWDAEESKAIIFQGKAGYKYPVELLDGISFIPVRLLEELDYRVNYNFSNTTQEHIITISYEENYNEK